MAYYPYRPRGQWYRHPYPAPPPFGFRQRGPAPQRHSGNYKPFKEQEEEYYFQNGMRKVYPYYFNFTTYAKPHWLGRTLLDVYSTEFGNESPDNYKKLIEQGELTVNGKGVSTEYVIKKNDFIEHRSHRHESPVLSNPVEVIEDTKEHIVINKPPSIPCHPTGRYRFNTLPFILKYENRIFNVHTVYKMDRLASGVYIIPKGFQATKKLEKELDEDKLEKEYVCRVVGKFPDGQVKCEEKIGVFSQKLSMFKTDKEEGKEATTTFSRLSYNGRSSVVQCVPTTSKPHQIRVHLQYLGYPIVNDPLYNSAAFGPNRGKGGKLDRPSEEIEKVIIQIRNCAVKKTTESPMFTKLVEKMKESKDQERVAQLQKAEKLLSNETNCNNGSEDDKSKDEPPVKKKKVKAVDDKDKKSDTKTPEKKSDDSEADKSDKKGENKQMPFNEEKYLRRMDKWCENCRKEIPDPRPSELVMYLHAVKLKGPDWEYSAPLPPWAKEDWKES